MKVLRMCISESSFFLTSFSSALKSQLTASLDKALILVRNTAATCTKPLTFSIFACCLLRRQERLATRVENDFPGVKYVIQTSKQYGVYSFRNLLLWYTSFSIKCSFHETTFKILPATTRFYSLHYKESLHASSSFHNNCYSRYRTVYVHLSAILAFEKERKVVLFHTKTLSSCATIPLKRLSLLYFLNIMGLLKNDNVLDPQILTSSNIHLNFFSQHKFGLPNVNYIHIDLQKHTLITFSKYELLLLDISSGSRRAEVFSRAQDIKPAAT